MNPAPGPARTSGPLRTISASGLLLEGLLVLGILASGASHAQIDARALEADRSAAVELARSGRYDEAADALARLRAIDPESVALLHDEILVLAWAERDAEVAARAELLDGARAPAAVQAAVAKSLRNLRRYADAVVWYERALAADDSATDIRLGLALAYADAQRFSDARAALEPLFGRVDQAVAVDLVLAYVDEHAGALLPALASYDRVLDIDAAQPEALRGKALVLRRLLLPSRALAIAEAHPGLLTDAEIERLRADEIALQVRYTAQAAYPPAKQHELMDRAIASLDGYLEEGVADASTMLALKSDRIIALAERRESAAAIGSFEQLSAQGYEAPAPVLAAAGKAYLDLRDPERARGVLERAVKLDPGNPELRFALFYAYAETRQHDAALALAHELVAEQPLVTGRPGTPTAHPNPDRIRAEILVAIALAYADRLEEAQAHLERWLAEAPNNLDLRHELANIYRWRGWIDRSLFEYQQVLTVEPELLEARVGKAQVELDRAEFDAVALAVEDLNREFGDEPSVERLTTLWTTHNRSELTIDATTHDSSGTTFGSSQYKVDLTWRSAPIDVRYRAFVTSRDTFAEFPEGDSRRRRLAAGLQYEYGRWLASGELSGARDGGGEVGARGSVAYRLDDYWQLSSAIELDSDSVPLRGYRVGVESDLLSVGARYEPHEELTLELTAVVEDMSDGNERRSLAAQGRRRLVNEPVFAVELIGEAFVGDRLRDDVPYFSPLHDVGALVGLEGQWRAVRRYEQRITHSLRGEIGFYDQAGYPRGTIWRVAYLLPIEISPTLSTWLGLWRNRMFYDGAEEYSTTASLTLQVRF